MSVSEEDGDSREESKDSERSRPSAALGGPRNRGLLRRTTFAREDEDDASMNLTNILMNRISSSN